MTTTSTTLDEPTPPRAPRDKAKYRSALSWSVAMVGGQQFVTAAVAFLLAAILGPEAFGTVAMASVYILFMQMLLQQAIPAIVQRKDLDPADLDSAFWLVMGFTLVITGISVALAGPWATANRTPDLQPIIIALSLQVPLQGLVVVQEAVLRRHMDFRSLAIRSLVAAAGGGVIGLALGLHGRRYLGARRPAGRQQHHRRRRAVEGERLAAAPPTSRGRTPRTWRGSRWGPRWPAWRRSSTSARTRC